jgi:hypothetical protein
LSGFGYLLAVDAGSISEPMIGGSCLLTKVEIATGLLVAVGCFGRGVDAWLTVLTHSLGLFQSGLG